MSGKVSSVNLSIVPYKECYNGIFIGSGCIAVISTLGMIAIFGANALAFRNTFLYAKTFGGLVALQGVCFTSMGVSRHHFKRLEEQEKKLKTIVVRPSSAPLPFRVVVKEKSTSPSSAPATLTSPLTAANILPPSPPTLIEPPRSSSPTPFGSVPPPERTLLGSVSSIGSKTTDDMSASAVSLQALLAEATKAPIVADADTPHHAGDASADVKVDTKKTESPTPPDLPQVVLEPLLTSIEALMIEWNRSAYYNYYPNYRPEKGDYEEVETQTAALKKVFAKLKEWGTDFIQDPTSITLFQTTVLSLFMPNPNLKGIKATLQAVGKAETLPTHVASFAKELVNFATLFNSVTERAKPLERPKKDTTTDGLVDKLLRMICPRYESSKFAASRTALGWIGEDKLYNQKEFITAFFEGTIYAFHYAFTDDMPHFRSAFKKVVKAAVNSFNNSIADQQTFEEVMDVFVRECNKLTLALSKIRT